MSLRENFTKKRKIYRARRTLDFVSRVVNKWTWSKNRARMVINRSICQLFSDLNIVISYWWDCSSISGLFLAIPFALMFSFSGHQVHSLCPSDDLSSNRFAINGSIHTKTWLMNIRQRISGVLYFWHCVECPYRMHFSLLRYFLTLSEYFKQLQWIYQYSLFICSFK